MKTNLLLLLVLLLTACKTSDNVVIDSTSSMSAREIVEKDVFINFTTEDSSPKTRGGAKIKLTSLPAFRAACYRFYKKMSYDKNNIGICNAKNGAELNMSEEIFNYFLQDTENLNEIIRQDLEKGIQRKNDAYQ